MKPYSIEAKAKKMFGITDIFQLGGYLMPNGEMLNFSYEGYQRDEDHRIIGQFFSKAVGTEAMLKFMRRGNIRMMCFPRRKYGFYGGVDYGFELIKKPTREQLNMLKEAWDDADVMESDFYIEIDDSKGKCKRTFRSFPCFKHYLETGEINYFCDRDLY